MYLLCTDVGPVRQEDFVRSRWRPRPEVAPAVATGPAVVATGGPPAEEAERVLRQVEQNLIVLTRTMHMVKIKDLHPSMQLRVLGVPWTWVQLFQRLENVIVHYGRAKMPSA
jgi:hypothetical protein